jgi:gamma-glutamylcyclotransferase (GGCT)/AIG2-like uncharacterized protein YtfP
MRATDVPQGGLFLYGTLLHPATFARFAGHAPLRLALPARASGWRRVGLRGTPYPTLRRGAGEVAGLLLPRLAPGAFARLSAYEGASYRLVPLRVATRFGPRRARAWLAPAWRAGPWPWSPARECDAPGFVRRARYTALWSACTRTGMD